MKVQFDEFTYKIDRWHGEIDFLMHCSGSTKLQISMRGDSSEITEKQKEDINRFISNYEQLWTTISKKIEEMEPNDEFELHPKISLALQGLVSGEDGAEFFEYIVGYKAYHDNKYIHSFMACINNMQISEIIVAN